jgi:ribose transport system permease protein
VSEKAIGQETTRRRLTLPGGLRLEQLTTLVPYVLLLVLVIIYNHNVSGALSRISLAITIAGGLTLALAAAGQAIVILTGGIDLSIGGIISLSTVIASQRFTEDWATIILWAAIIVALGGAAGLVNGLLIVKLGLQPFIVTLATWSLWGGVALWIQPVEGGVIPIRLLNVMNETYLGLGTPIWIVIGLFGFWIAIRRSALIYRIRAIGSNREAAYLSGISPLVTISAAYALSGAFAALAGLFLATQMSSGDPGSGDSFILQSVAAVVIGGASLRGGRGSVAAAVVGSFVLTLSGSVVFALGYSSQFEDVVRALILVGAILAVSGGSLLQRRRSGRLT